MRTRDLKPGFFRNEALSALPSLTRLLYQGLWLMADREGRLLDNAKLIEAEVFPYEKVNIERGLKQLAAGDDPFIIRYYVAGKHCIWLPKFLSNQRPHPHEVASQLPQCPDDVTAMSRQGNDTGQPMSRLDPPHSLTLSQSSDLATSDLSSSQSARERLKALVAFTDDDWRDLIAKHPDTNPHARFWEWLDWIGEREGERMPEKPLAAFHGWLEKKNGMSKPSAAAAR